MDEVVKPYRAEQKTPTSLVVIEVHFTPPSDGMGCGESEWWLSFDGHNPTYADSFRMYDADAAFNLKEKLAPLFPPHKS